MKIAVRNPENLFAIFYIFSFVVTFLIVIAFTFKRKIPLRSVLLMMTTISFMTIAGSRLFTIPVSQWGPMIRTGSFEGYDGRFAAGGLVFGLAGLIVSRHIFKLDTSVIRLYGWLTPLGLGIQKIGCFFNGCCYGTRSSIPWAVQYPVCSNAHYFQWSHGIIAENASWSLPLHPVQLYETIGLFLISFIVWRTRNIWKKSWSVLIFSLLLFCLSRFITEFFRDPSAAYFGGNYSGGIKVIQWILLLACLIAGISLLFSELIKINAGRSVSDTLAPVESIFYLFVISAFIYLFRGLFTGFELISLYIKLVPAILLTGLYFYNSLSLIKIRLATISSLAFPLFMITMTLPQDTVRQKISPERFYRNEVKEYTRIDFGTSFGTIYGDLAYNPHEGSCGTEYTHEDYRHNFVMMGAGYSKIKYAGKGTETFGINIFGGSNHENNLTKSGDAVNFLIGVNPYFKYDRKWIGLGVGLNAGNLRWIPISHIDQPTFNSGTRFSPVMPEASVRLGRRDILDFRYSYGRIFPSSFPVLNHELSIGSGFGTVNLLNVRFGVEYADYENKFVSLEVLPDKQLGLNLKYNWGIYYRPSETPHFSWLTLNASYRFGFKK